MLQITNDNPNCNMGYNYGGYGYNTTNTNDDGLLHLLGGQRELIKAIYDSENDIRTNLERNCNNNNLELTIRNVINNSNITRT